jgi:DNA-binding protein
MSDNTIFVGDKPFLNYVTGIVLQFTMYNEQTVHVKARGKHISRAVDVVEATVKRFLANKIAVERVSIDSEEAQSRDGESLRVSHISITVHRVVDTAPSAAVSE